MQNKIEIKKLNVHFKNKVVLSNVNVDIKNGDFVYILGPNGGGKPTLIKVILKLIKPTSGIVINTFKNIGYVMQNINIKDNFPASVYEVIYSGFLKQHLFINKKDKEKILDLLKLIKLDGYYNKQINTLSGGELQRIMFARCIASSPDLIVLDEPISAIDQSFRVEFNEILKELNNQGKTIIIITHDLNGIDLTKCRDKIYYIDKIIKYDGLFCQYYEKYLKTKEHFHHG